MVTKYNIDDTVYIKGTVSMIKVGKGSNGADLTYNVKVKDSPGSTVLMVMRENDLIAGDASTIIPVDIGTLKNLRDALSRVDASSYDGNTTISECCAILTHLITKNFMEKYKEKKNDKL